MINVLHVIDSLTGSGVDHQLELTLKALDPQRVQSFVCYLRGPSEMEQQIQEQGIPVHRLNVGGIPQWPSAVFGLRRLVKSLDIDLIHTQLFDADVVGGVAGKLTGVPVVSTLANTIYDPEWLANNPHVNSVKLKFPKVTRRLLAKYLNQHVVAVSDLVKQAAIHNMAIGDDKVTVIHRALFPTWLENGGPNGKALPRATDIDPSLEDHYPIIINTGRLAPNKGQQYMFQAMPAILERYPKAALVMAGEGDLRRPLAAKADKLGIVGQVKFLGRHDNAKDLLRISDVFAFPSLYEGYPNELLEAMSMGVPCVASSISPVREVTKDGKLATVVPIRDAEGLANGIIDTVANMESAKIMAQTASDSVRRDYTVETVAAKLTRIYEDCVGVEAGANIPHRNQKNTRIK